MSPSYYINKINHRHVILAMCMVISMACVLLSTYVGSVDFSLSEWGRAILYVIQQDNISDITTTLFILRLKRALLAFIVGASLSLAGLSMQILFHNALADPYVLGVSGGASVCALIVMVLGGSSWMIDSAALVGALFMILILFCLNWKNWASEWQTHHLLLTGVMLSAGCGAFIALLLSIAPDYRLHQIIFWLMGDLSHSNLHYLPWIVALLILPVWLYHAEAIRVFLLYGDHAKTLGVHTNHLQCILLIGGALLTAASVSSVGSIGFIGLIVPHVCRLAWGADMRILFPAVFFIGGCFLVLSDTLARTVIAPQQLPVGVVTALIGVPLFLLQLNHQRSKPYG